MRRREIGLRLDQGAPEWGPLLNALQAGVGIETRLGLSVRAFARETLGFDDQYIEGRISTVFLDSEPVDDIDAATVRAGSRIALSAAMPGLVGAVMRRGSPYASFRKGISYGDKPGDGPPAEADPGSGLVTVKFFNSIMEEKGRAILGRGVVIGALELAAIAPDAMGGIPPAPGELVSLKVELGR
jgi:hypothetical protein